MTPTSGDYLGTSHPQVLTVDNKETPVITLDNLDAIHLDTGSHPDPANGVCVMEAAALLAGDSFTDHPACVSPVIGAFLRTWNDTLGDDDRQQLKQHLPTILNTATTKEDEETRAWMATDWLVRVHTPVWLRLAGLDGQASILEGMAPLDAVTCPTILPALKAVRSDAAAARDAAWDTARDAAGAAAGAAARDAAGAAAGAAARDAAGAAAGAAAWDAAWAAAGAAARDAAGAAAWDAAWDAAWAAAVAAARAALRPSVEALQVSAHELVTRMCEVGRAA